MSVEEALVSVKKLHHKETRYMVEGWDDRSWDSMDEVIDYYGSFNEIPGEVKTFDICAECGRIEWHASDFNYVGGVSAWPCATAKAMGEK